MERGVCPWPWNHGALLDFVMKGCEAVTLPRWGEGRVCVCLERPRRPCSRRRLETQSFPNKLEQENSSTRGPFFFSLSDPSVLLAMNTNVNTRTTAEEAPFGPGFGWGEADAQSAN